MWVFSGDQVSPFEVSLLVALVRCALVQLGQSASMVLDGLSQEVLCKYTAGTLDLRMGSGHKTRLRLARNNTLQTHAVRMLGPAYPLFHSAALLYCAALLSDAHAAQGNWNVVSKLEITR